jgi:hypothetical protein
MPQATIHPSPIPRRGGLIYKLITFAIRALVGGLAFAVIGAVCVVLVEFVRVSNENMQASPATLDLSFDGISNLMQSPMAAIILGAAFILGVFFAARASR